MALVVAILAGGNKAVWIERVVKQTLQDCSVYRRKNKFITVFAILRLARKCSMY